MILLYIISILCSALLFTPDFIPAVVKWPAALLLVLLVVFFFNKKKGDTLYTTKTCEKKVISYGLFNPLIIFLAASLYTLGFALIISHLKELMIYDFVGDLDKITEVFALDLSNSLFCGVIFLVLSIFIYYLRNSFKENSIESPLRFRCVWYVLLTVITALIGIFTIDSFGQLDVFEYLEEGYNLYIYLGVPSLFVLIELVIKLIAHRRAKKKAKKAQESK